MKRHFDLLEDAEDFLEAAKELYKVKRWAKVCFMAQQAAELAVKAALSNLGKERFGHDIHNLLEELSKEISDVSYLIDEAKILDQYYIPTRYANAFAEGSAASHFTEEQAKDAISKAERILHMMKEIVKK